MFFPKKLLADLKCHKIVITSCFNKKNVGVEICKP